MYVFRCIPSIDSIKHLDYPKFYLEKTKNISFPDIAILWPTSLTQNIIKKDNLTPKTTYVEDKQIINNINNDFYFYNV